MSMYLPNDDVEPTGEEAAEFIAEPTADERAEEGPDGDLPTETARRDPAPDPDR